MSIKYLPTCILLTCFFPSIALANLENFIHSDESNSNVPKTLSKEKCLTTISKFGIGKNYLNMDDINSGVQQINCIQDNDQLLFKISNMYSSGIWVIRGWEDWSSPYIVALYKENPQTKGGDSYCTGVVVSKTHVLTAAHCYPDTYGYIRTDNGKPKVESVGTNIFKIKTVDYVAKDKTIFPEQPISTFGSDLAVITIDGNFPSYVSVGQIIYDYDLSSKSKLKVTGYGKSEFDQKNVKRTAAIALYDKACQDAGGKPNSPSKFKCVPQREFIAGNQDIGSDACAGDSGGPILMQTVGKNNWGILGLVSREAVEKTTLGCGKAGTIYTSLTPYASYLQKKGIQAPKTIPNRVLSESILK